MHNDERTIAQRIKELEGSVQKARLEAMKLAAALLMKSDSLLSATVGSNERPKDDLAALRARYQGLVRQAEDAQAQLDKLQAEQHDRKYHR